MATAFGNGWSAGFMVLGVTTTTADTQTTTTDQSFTITKTQGTITGVKSVIDTVDHDQDMFYVWLSPKINFSQPYATIPSLTLTLVPADPTAPDPTRTITVEVVRGAKPDLDHTMDGWTDADKKNLLAQDPFIAQSSVNSTTGNLVTVDPTAADPNRFTLIREIQTQGPDSVGGDIPIRGAANASSSSQCNKSTQTDQSTVTIGASYSFMGIIGASASGSFSTSYSTSDQACNGTSQSATVTLQSSTPGNYRPIAVYFDSTFATFAFVDRTPSPLTTNLSSPLGRNITGRITNSSGSPLANQQINVTFANGITRTLFSDSKGDYTIVSPPAGTMTIRSGDLVQQGSVVADKSAVMPLKVLNPKAPLPEPTVPLRATTPRSP